MKITWILLISICLSSQGIASSNTTRTGTIHNLPLLSSCIEPQRKKELALSLHKFFVYEEFSTIRQLIVKNIAPLLQNLQKATVAGRLEPKLKQLAEKYYRSAVIQQNLTPEKAKALKQNLQNIVNSQAFSKAQLQKKLLLPLAFLQAVQQGAKQTSFINFERALRVLISNVDEYMTKISLYQELLRPVKNPRIQKLLKTASGQILRLSMFANKLRSDTDSILGFIDKDAPVLCSPEAYLKALGVSDRNNYRNLQNRLRRNDPFNKRMNSRMIKGRPKLSMPMMRQGMRMPFPLMRSIEQQRSIIMPPLMTPGTQPPMGQGMIPPLPPMNPGAQLSMDQGVMPPPPLMNPGAQPPMGQGVMPPLPPMNPGAQPPMGQGMMPPLPPMNPGAQPPMGQGMMPPPLSMNPGAQPPMGQGIIPPLPPMNPGAQLPMGQGSMMPPPPSINPEAQPPMAQGMIPPLPPMNPGAQPPMGQGSMMPPPPSINPGKPAILCPQAGTPGNTTNIDASQNFSTPPAMNFTQQNPGNINNQGGMGSSNTNSKISSLPCMLPNGVNPAIPGIHPNSTPYMLPNIGLNSSNALFTNQNPFEDMCPCSQLTDQEEDDDEEEDEFSTDLDEEDSHVVSFSKRGSANRQAYFKRHFANMMLNPEVGRGNASHYANGNFYPTMNSGMLASPFNQYQNACTNIQNPYNGYSANLYRANYTGQAPYSSLPPTQCLAGELSRSMQTPFMNNGMGYSYYPANSAPNMYQANISRYPANSSNTQCIATATKLDTPTIAQPAPATSDSIVNQQNASSSEPTNALPPADLPPPIAPDPAETARLAAEAQQREAQAAAEAAKQAEENERKAEEERQKEAQLAREAAEKRRLEIEAEKSLAVIPPEAISEDGVAKVYANTPGAGQPPSPTIEEKDGVAVVYADSTKVVPAKPIVQPEKVAPPAQKTPPKPSAFNRAIGSVTSFKDRLFGKKKPTKT